KFKRNMAKEQPQGLALRRKLERLQLELSNIKLGTQSYVPGQGINGNWGVPRYGVGEEVHDQTEADGAVFDKVKPKQVADSFVLPFMRNLSSPNSNGIHHGEGCSSNASDISLPKGYDPSFPSSVLYWRYVCMWRKTANE
ncbi:hypothetical protein V8G54_006082, partial [Vigna mungo]